MDKIRNRILTISGEPASGKSTVVKEIKNKYEEQGFNVYIISVGNVFREMVKKEYLKKYPDRVDTSLADIQNDEDFMAKVRSIDGLIDNEIAKKGREINEKARPNDVYIIDSRLAWSNVPDSYAIRLTINEAIAGKRVFYDTTRGAEDQYETLDEAIQKTKKRKLGEIERYKKRYGIDLLDENNYDLVIDTSYTNTKELADIIVTGEEAYRTGKSYPKYWANPTCFMPLQIPKNIEEVSESRETIQGLAKKIKENGYKTPEGILEIIKRNGIKYLVKGLHRTFGALSASKTLLPYEISKKKISSEPILSEENLRSYAEKIRYYSGEVGNTKQLKNFTIENLLEMNNMTFTDLCNPTEREH